MYPDRPDPSHIDSLPNELLAEIFKLDADRINRRFGDGTPRRFTGSVLPNEVVYSHVSRRWRNVATNLPALWTRIYVIVHSSLLWLPHYLSRSQCCHLDVWIDRSTYCGWEDPERKIADVMNLLIPHANRWSILRVGGVHESSIYLVLSHLENISTPVLRKFEVEFRLEMWVGLIEQSSIPFNILQGGAPLLTSIQMGILQRCWPPLSALTTCTIDSFNRSATCTQFIQALASSHALTNLRVRGLGRYDEPSEFDIPSRIQLDTLKSLWLDISSRCDFLSPLLLAISAPRLEILKLQTVVDSMLHRLFNSPQRSLVEFPALHTLSLHSVQLGNYSYIQLSRMFPSITHLEVSGLFQRDFQRLAQLIGSPRDLYETEARDTSDGRWVTADIIWPKLRTIMVGKLNNDPSDPPDMIGDALQDLLAARRELGRPIERLVLEDNLLEMGRTDGVINLREYLELSEHPSYYESWGRSITTVASYDVHSFRVW